MNTSPPICEEWYAIYTKSRFEKKINQALQKSGFQTFLPLIKEKRAWSDRLKTIEVPLLPSYVFLKTKTTDFSRVYYLPGFVKFVSMNGKPCTLKEEDINLMHQIASGHYPVTVTGNCDIGDSVRVTQGPLKGWEGKINRKVGASRIVFQFTSIQQSISVEIPINYIEKCSGEVTIAQ